MIEIDTLDGLPNNFGRGAMLDMLIRSGTVVDGTGSPAFIADIGINDGKIVQVGTVSELARREIDAEGLVVAPGWIDIHTHYDGQATWDCQLDPSFSSGVTTAIMGNCGVGFAPVRPGMQERLIELMEGVEEIPGTALHVGMDWKWNTFPEYLDVLSGMPRSFDIGCLIPHGPLRLWAMGDKVGTDKSASGFELEIMTKEVEDSMKAGAFGLATSRTPIHRTSRGDMTPDYHVDLPELVALCRIVKAHSGYFQVVPEGIAGEDMDALRSDMELIESVVKQTDVNLHVLVFQLASEPDYYLNQLEKLEKMNGRGRVTAQFGGRGTGAILGFLGSNPFVNTPTFRKISQLSIDDWLHELAKPAIRTAILSEENEPGSMGALLHSGLSRMYDLGENLDYEPGIERSFLALAENEDKSLAEFTYDFMLENSVHPRAYVAFTNYSGGTLDVVTEALSRSHVALSASDAGAHVLTVADGAIHSFMLTHFGRDRKRGATLPIEQIVHWMTLKPALSIGLTDRGTIARGKKADLNIFDLKSLKVHPPEYRADLPGGARRIVTDVTGYRATLVNGIPTREYDKPTGAMPGQLVRRV